MYEDLLDSIDAAIGSFVIDLFTGISNDITSTLRLMLILSIILYGFAMMKGWIETSLKDATKHIFMGLIIYIFATNVGLFTSVLYDIFTNSPNQLMGAVLASGGGPNENGINTFIGNAYDQGIRAAGDLLFGSSWNAIGLKIMGFLVAAATIAMCGYSAFLVVMSKIAVAILLGLSPIFIAFMMFKTTRGLFEGWLRQLLNFAIIPVLTYTIMLFCLAIVATPINDMNIAQANGNLTTVEVMPYLITCAVSFLLLMQVMGIASGIAGGMSLSTLGVVANRFSKYGAFSVNNMKGINLRMPSFGKNSIKN
jgi:type IV secretion system protein VirB6